MEGSAGDPRRALLGCGCPTATRWARAGPHRDKCPPIEPKQVTVQRINTPGLSAIYVAADYYVTVNLPFYSFDMHFTPNSGNK